MRVCTFTLSVMLWTCLNSTSMAAASVNRCENMQGNIRFTEQACTADEMQTQQNIKLNTPIQLGVNSDAKKAKSRATVRGISTPKTHCQTGLDAQQLRRAIIKQELYTGMTQAQVTAALGRPAHISNKNSRVQYSYQPNQGKKQLVQFDENGCLKR